MLYNISVSDKELETIILGLKEREGRMFKDSEAYMYQGNRAAQMDCIREWHAAEHLRERLEKMQTKTN